MPLKRGSTIDTPAYEAVLEELRKDPQASHQDIADRTGWSLATVKRKRRRILKEQKIPDLPQRAPGRPRKSEE